MNPQFEEAVKLVPMVAVFISLLALLASLRKDRKLRLKEYADRVRRSAALVVARADRWKHLSLGLFQDIQVAITDADIMLVKERDVRKADDFFWREMFIVQRAIAKKLSDEQIEIAYADLFGYDTKIHNLYGALIQKLTATDRRVFVALLKRTQGDILGSHKEDGIYVSTVLGNQLRVTAKEISAWCSDLMEAALVEFRNEMIKLVQATDETIVRRKLAIRGPAEVFAGFHEIEMLSAVREVKISGVGSLLGVPDESSRVPLLLDPSNSPSSNPVLVQAPATELHQPSMNISEQIRPTEPQSFVSTEANSPMANQNSNLPTLPSSVSVEDYQQHSPIANVVVTDKNGRKSSAKGRKKPESAKRNLSYVERDPDPDISPLIPPCSPTLAPPSRGGYGDDDEGY